MRRKDAVSRQPRNLADTIRMTLEIARLADEARRSNPDLVRWLEERNQRVKATR